MATASVSPWFFTCNVTVMLSLVPGLEGVHVILKGVRFGLLTPTAVPANGTFSGVSKSLDGIERFALFAPSNVGEKTTSTVQVAGGAEVHPEHSSFRMLNSAASVPVSVIDPIERIPPVFETVNVLAEDVIPTFTLPKS
ncbi:MAG: hypothetical protein C5S38_04745 [Candidatus Methanophagaceae archaeon]|nr:MAG: hypothetical protein C5S38_04745 [Methanophagales archaeon]